MGIRGRFLSFLILCNQVLNFSPNFVHDCNIRTVLCCVTAHYSKQNDTRVSTHTKRNKWNTSLYKSNLLALLASTFDTARVNNLLIWQFITLVAFLGANLNTTLAKTAASPPEANSELCKAYGRRNPAERPPLFGDSFIIKTIVIEASLHLSVYCLRNLTISVFNLYFLFPTSIRPLTENVIIA